MEAPASGISSIQGGEQLCLLVDYSSGGCLQATPQYWGGQDQCHHAQGLLTLRARCLPSHFAIN